MNMPRMIDAKTILNKVKGEDGLFGLTYNMNLYRGCQHACIYCDSRSLCYQLGELSDIREKKDALKLLSKEIAKKRVVGTIGTGSMNDPYMPVEQERKLTRGAMEIVAVHRFPVHVITKSDLITRDIDILRDISRIYAAASLTITCADDDLSKQIEPGATVSSKRFKAIYELRKNNIYTGVIITPILPWITDSIDNLQLLIKKAQDHGAHYVLFWPGTTQRQGQREYFYKKLDVLFPDLKKQYEKIYGEKYECLSPNYKQLNEEFIKLTDQFQLQRKMNFYSNNEPVIQKLL